MRELCELVQEREKLCASMGASELKSLLIESHQLRDELLDSIYNQ